MPTDIEIAQKAKLVRIARIAKERLGIDDEHLEPYGHYKAKVSLDYLESLKDRPLAKLILVTAISPTPAGEGKTTTTVGLGDALNRIGKKTIICLREPSLGPVFGMKGGAAGGGLAQVVPMEDINLHFTGDFNAIQLANNLLAALIDNHIHHGNELGFDVRRITWKRVLDMNDRALRDITLSLGGPGNGFPRQDGFDIVVASEVMAIFCLATSLADLKERLGNIVVGYTREHRPITARELRRPRRHDRSAEGRAQAESRADAREQPGFHPRRPFREHRARLQFGHRHKRRHRDLADYVVTEAGFGADLGAEKFVDIKCRKSGLRPDAVVIVATVRALKYHGGVDLKTSERGEPGGAGEGHLESRAARQQRAQPLRAAVCRLDQPVHPRHRGRNAAAEEEDGASRRAGDRRAALGRRRQGRRGRRPGRGGDDRLHRRPTSSSSTTETASLWDKIKAVATKIYGAAEVTADSKGPRPDQEAPGRRLRTLPDLRRQDPVFVLDRPVVARRAERARHQRARGAARCRRRVHGHGLRRHHDDAGPAETSVVGADRHRREGQTWWGCSEVAPESIRGAAPLFLPARDVAARCFDAKPAKERRVPRWRRAIRESRILRAGAQPAI